MPIKVRIKGHVCHKSVVIQASTVAKPHHSPTIISRKTAEVIGILGACQDIYVFNDGDLEKWSIPQIPVTLLLEDFNITTTCFPLIASKDSDYETTLLIGHNLQATILANYRIDLQYFSAKFSEAGVKPTRSISSIPKVALALKNELPNRINEFLEFPCFDSEAIQRLAINSVTRQLVVVYISSSNVYRYAQLPR